MVTRPPGSSIPGFQDVHTQEESVQGVLPQRGVLSTSRLGHRTSNFSGEQEDDLRVSKGLHLGQERELGDRGLAAWVLTTSSLALFSRREVLLWSSSPPLHAGSTSDFHLSFRRWLLNRENGHPLDLTQRNVARRPQT